MKFDMLQIKKDRVTEIKKQIVKYSKSKNWSIINKLRTEQRQLQSEIKHMEGDMLGR